MTGLLSLRDEEGETIRGRREEGGRMKFKRFSVGGKGRRGREAGEDEAK